MRNKIAALFILLLLGAGVFVVAQYLPQNGPVMNNPLTDEPLDEADSEDSVHPLSIESLKQGEYPGSDLVIEETLAPGSNYSRYIASYESEGNKIYGLLTVPNADATDEGYPTIIFNHGYIPPTEYRTTERYIAYTDVFSRNGYVLFRPDYRGHGSSEGEPSGAYGSNGYTIDVLNALASVKKLDYVDASRIGMWGHSMGGHITLRVMVVSPDVKAGVIWAGVVGSYPDLINNWRRRQGNDLTPFPTTSSRGGWRQGLISQYGSPEENPNFWNSLSANSYLSDISGPIQLHHGTADTSVPYQFSETLDEQMRANGREVEIYLYPSDDHNIATNFGIAAARSVEFFDKYLKN